jgi:hypothetical protein
MDVTNDLHMPVLAVVPNRPLVRTGMPAPTARAVTTDERSPDMTAIVQQPLTSSLAQNPNE